MAVRALIAAGAAFGVAAVVLTVFTLWRPDRSKVRDAWTVYALQFLTMGVILVPAYVGGLLFSAVAAALASICLLELFGMPKEPVPLPLRAGVVAFGLGTFALAHFLPFPALYLSVPAAAAALLVTSLFSSDGLRYLQGAGQSLLGLVYVPVFMAHIVLIRKLDNGFLIIFFMYGVSEIHDSFAYMFGRMLGRKKIFPNISPNKTWVGSASGIVAAAAAGLFVNLTVTRFSAAFAVALAAVVICFTILGDLVSSRIKRAHGVKDFGTLIPRTGGVLDAYDSLLFTAPFVFWLSTLLRG